MGKSWKPSVSGAFCVIGNCFAMFLLHKKRSAQDRTAAEWNHVAKATRRRRRILQKQDPFLCFVLKCLLGRTPLYSNIYSNLWIKKKRQSYLERSIRMLEKRPGKVEHPAWFQVCDRLRSEKYGQSLSLRCVGLCLTNSLPYRWLPLYHGRAESASGHPEEQEGMAALDRP